MKSVLCALVALAFSNPAHAGARVELGGGYSYANLQYAGAGGAGFTMLSDKGLFASGEVGLGTENFEVFGTYHLSQDKYAAPASRTLVNPSVQRSDIAGGLRLMTRNFAFAAKYVQRGSVLLEDQGNNTYELSTVSPSIAAASIQFAAREKLLSIMIEIEAGMPLAAVSTTDVSGNSMDVKVSQYMSANAKINVGNVWRTSLYGGVKNVTYKSDDRYYGFDIFAGLIFSTAFSFGGGGGSSGRTDGVPFSYSGPRYPL